MSRAEVDLPPSPASARRDPGLGYLFGFLGVASFSLTLPATRVAVAALDPVFVGLGRAIVAALLAAIVLVIQRVPWPGWALLPRLALVAGGVVVVAFALWHGGGAPQLADGLLVLAVIAAAIGYAEGARLARTLGSWQVISWALLIAAPIVAIPAAMSVDARALSAPASAWVGFAYVSVVSMYLGFFAWYRGLAEGGIAAVGQVQLLQPFLTIFASALLLDERIDAATIVAAGLVIASIALGRRFS